MSEKTIAAIATPIGEGSIGVIRISGDKAIGTADKVFVSFSGKKLCELKGYSAAYGEIRDGENVLDDAVALVFRAPHSYTGEDVVEISVHGGKLMLRSILRLIFANGAVSAAAGEFSKRAFLNGKLDLTRAESIMGLISAKSESQLRVSRAAHTGRVSKKISEIEDALVSSAAAIAAYSDYPDEDIEGLDGEHFSEMLNNACDSLKDMLNTYDAGRVLSEGISTAIVGKPNVGKSTLMNLLSGGERSIVTDVAGTTRDVVEDTVVLGDITLLLADTAGIRTTDDPVEKIGVDRARSRIDEAGLVLAVFDGSKPLDSDDQTILKSVNKNNTVIVINKSDKGSDCDINAFNGFKTVEISAKTGQGYDELRSAVEELTGIAGLDPDSPVLLGERQRDLAVRALNSVEEARQALADGYTVDAVGVCIDDAIGALFELTGKRVTNEVADEVFRKFCVGK